MISLGRMRFAVGLALMAALGAVACKKRSPTMAPTGPGSSVESGSSAPVGSAVRSGGASVSVVSAGSAGSAATAFDGTASLDAALKGKGIVDKDIAKRATGPHSAWALVVSKTRDGGFVTEYTLLRASKEGIAELHIPALGGNDPSLDKDIDTFDVRDLDGDGHDECVAVIAWQRGFEIPYKKGCKRCFWMAGETGKELNVIHDDSSGYLAIAFEHLVEYGTLFQAAADDPDPPPEEKIAYDWKVDGKPPVVTLTRTDYQLNKQRSKELLDPATDPLLSAGSGAAIPLALK